MADPVTIRLPDDLRLTVAGLARTERRSFSAQTVWLVEAGLRASAAHTPREDEVLATLVETFDAHEVPA